jgi:hypothetical protein
MPEIVKHGLDLHKGNMDCQFVRSVIETFHYIH